MTQQLDREGCALVTGASRGIGAAIARSLAADGWVVGVNYRTDAEGAERVVAQIEAGGGSAVALAGDVAEAGTADELIGWLEDAHGSVQILVNNAGIRADGLSPQIDDEDWARVIETNLSGAFRLSRRALRPMLRRRFGRIINVASVVGLRANPGQANYAASKAGLIGFTKTMAAEVARRNVTVNAVAPGFIETELTSDVPREFVGLVPARRAGTCDEVAACVRFLASPDASYVTGITLTVDGGLSA